MPSKSSQKKRDSKQRRAFEFLLDKYNSQLPFTREQFQAATGWDKPGTFDTYWDKQFENLLAPLRDGTYRVSQVFVKFNTWPKFQTHVTQTRKVITDYKPETIKHVMQFEFFMPLANEGYLRASLDALFYKETVLSRLRSVERSELEAFFQPEIGQSDAGYYDRICDWISSVFGGYSISHVSGRFKADDLKTREEASKSDRYLVDETTAVVRFIFPCNDRNIPLEDQVKRIRFFFELLFVQNIVEVINGEDEIWMIEGGVNSQLHIWRAQSD